MAEKRDRHHVLVEASQHRNPRRAVCSRREIQMPRALLNHQPTGGVIG
jgi:hypothetical protein